MIQYPPAIKTLDGEVLHVTHVTIDVDRKANHLDFEPMSRETRA